MDFTQSPQFDTHAGTGQRKHQAVSATPTVVSDKDMNQVIWSMMELLKSAGLAGQQFDPDIPASYTKFRDALQIIYGDGVGRVSFFPFATAPIGYVKANGALLNRVAFSRLFAKYGTTFGVGDGLTTFGTPDWRGEFFRSLDDGRGIDIGRVLNSFQVDAFKSHNHPALSSRGVITSASGVGSVAANLTFGGGGNFSSDSALAFEGAVETRPRNVALLACIKI